MVFTKSSSVLLAFPPVISARMVFLFQTSQPSSRFTCNGNPVYRIIDCMKQHCDAIKIHQTDSFAFATPVMILSDNVVVIRSAM